MERAPEGKFFIRSGGSSNFISIIAIMLGRLEMDVDECIEAYTGMFKTIFGKKGLPLNMWGNIKGRFDSAVLDKCIRNILKDRGLPEREPLNDGNERCKVYACLLSSTYSNLNIGLSAQKPSRLRPQYFCDLIPLTMPSTIFRLRYAKLCEQHQRQPASSIQSQLGHGSESL